MGFLEAVKCGVSQSAELAGSGPNQRKTESRRLVGTRLLSPPPTQHLLLLCTQGIRLLATQKTPSQALCAELCPLKIHMLKS